MCGVQLKDRKRSKDLMLMLCLNKINYDTSQGKLLLMKIASFGICINMHSHNTCITGSILHINLNESLHFLIWC